MLKHALVTSAVDFAAGLQPRTKYLLALWALFSLLVAFGIHGSSTGITAQWWSPERRYSGYLLKSTNQSTGVEPGFLDTLLMADARGIRWDELLVATPLALSQLSHKPRFPVVNTNIGNGQNQLLSPHAAVWHVATLARPATWGYFFLGAQRGLAWYWWFRVFSCFTVLYLLLEIILKGHPVLAAFGSFWFCASAYDVCWSLWPAQLVFFGALSCLAAYHLLASSKRSTQVVSGLLLGLSIAGFVMFLYPPWQVSVGYLAFFIFAGLFIRDRLYRSFTPVSRYRLLSLILAILVAVGLVLSFVLSCLPDLKAMSNTVYPGKRVSLGGDYSFAMLFKGLYNLTTIYTVQPKIGNESEASSFYYFFPAVFLAIVLSKRLRIRLGALGWLLVSYLVAMLLFALVGVPEKIARLTLMGYVPPYRADIAIGLASIILSVYVLALIKDSNRESESKWSKIVPLIVGGVVILVYYFHGLVLERAADGFPPSNLILIASLLAGLLSYCLVAGKSALFAGALSAILVATTALFNPLATNLDHIYNSELAQQIVKLDDESTDRPLWICYGGVYPGMLVTTLGGRSISGIHWPPQLSLWRSLDPSGGGYENIYNRFAEVSLAYRDDANWVSFNNPTDGTMVVRISPTHPGLRALGARYVLAMGDAQSDIESARLPLLYKSSSGSFSIFEIPDLEKAQATGQPH